MWAPDYVDIEVVKTNLRIDNDDDSDDLLLGILIDAASRAVDHATNRQFGQTTATAFYYDGLRSTAGGWPPPVAAGQSSLWGDRQAVEVDDLMTVEDLVVKFDQDGDATFEETITAYDLWPWNAAAKGKPWTHIVLRSSVSVPTGERTVEVTGRFGWSDVPRTVAEATLLQINRWYKRRDAAFGVAGSPDMGSELRLLAKLDPDVAVLVAQLHRPWAAA